MNIQLVLAGHYTSCKETEKIWSVACLQHGIELEVLNLEKPDGEMLSLELNISSYPALIVNKIVKAVGNPDQDTANKIINKIVQENISGH